MRVCRDMYIWVTGVWFACNTKLGQSTWQQGECWLLLERLTWLQTSAESELNWEGEIPTHIDPHYLGLTQTEKAAVLRHMKTRSLEVHPIGAKSISFRGTPPESTALLQ